MRSAARTAWLALGAALAGCAPADRAGVPAPHDSMHVWVFFTRDERPYPVPREVPRTTAVLRASLEQLVAGPTPDERARGLTSWFSPETAHILDSVAIDADGNVRLELHDFRHLIPGASTSAGSRMLLAELNSTIFQYETVRSVDYRIGGSCEDFWHFLQRPCAVLRRPG